MDDKHESHTHTKTNTTFRGRASYWPITCSFFCSRITDTDVVDPKKQADTKKEEEKVDSKPGL
jgi:hypothetical protein